MRTIKFILLSALFTSLFTFCISCGNPNHPVQTASDVTPAQTPGATSVKPDSVTTSKKGPDQMVPDNTGPTQDSMHSGRKKTSTHK